MSQRARFIYKIVSIGIALLCLLSCAPKPEIEWVPQIKSVSAKVSGNTCVLTAEVSADLTDGYACGFFYGKDEDSMQRVQARVEDKKFICTLESLDYETDYFYKAYVSNGRNEISSDLRQFQTFKEIEPPKTMTLPFNTIEVDPEETEFTLQVGGDADFTVNIPEDVSWIYVRSEGRECRFRVIANTGNSGRRSDIVFTNLFDNQSDTLTVVQAAKVNQDNLPAYRKDVPYTASNLSVLLPEASLGEIRFALDGSQHTHWVRWLMTDQSDRTRLDFFFEENPAPNERKCNLIITYCGTDYFLEIVQKSWNGNIDFEDLLVKKICVDAFDIDMDGELGYYEAAMQKTIHNLDFSGMDIRSFDEFQWFVNVRGIADMVFYGSRIKSIVFPNSFTNLNGQVFENCTELEDIDLSDIAVLCSFKGCTSLENVRTRIDGCSSFEDCTSLETAVQQSTGVPEYALKNCRSLRSFEFDIAYNCIHYIGEEAFRGCISLPEITIPEDIREIQNKAFYGCSSLSSISMEPLDPPALGEKVFDGTNPDLKIYVPLESVELYKTAWPSMAERITVRSLTVLHSYK